MRVPPALTIIPVSESRELFRIVKTSDGADPDLIESFKSNCELGRPLRPNSAETVYRSIWHAISMFSTLEAARSVAFRFPAMGNFIARLVLKPNRGFSLAEWGSPKHVSVWGDYSHLREAIVDIVPVEESE